MNTSTPRPSDPPELAAPEDADARPRAGRANEIRHVLQEEIESGKLAPGSPLDERALAARFAVSRTPVREAIQQLAARELVTVQPRQGITVARLSVSKVRAVLESIAEMETVAAKLAARRVDESLRARLDEAMARCQEAAVAGGTAEYAIANTFFHEVVYAGSRNPYLAEQIRAARRLILRYRVRDFQSRSQLARSLQDHLRIARAIQSGDEAAAADAMMRHVPSGTTEFSEFLAMVPGHFFDNESGGA